MYLYTISLDLRCENIIGCTLYYLLRFLRVGMSKEGVIHWSYLAYFYNLWANIITLCAKLNYQQKAADSRNDSALYGSFKQPHERWWNFVPYLPYLPTLPSHHPLTYTGTIQLSLTEFCISHADHHPSHILLQALVVSMTSIPACVWVTPHIILTSPQLSDTHLNPSKFP